ncbi:sensor histidine kinase [Metabacillus idriensis]|uniref:sensor histidine kinase n=1 Tax=Metabacillus idriensis TaxID=324768 RepID=UPI003D2950C1
MLINKLVNQMKQKVFNKILMVYSIILILVMFLLLSVLWNYYTDVVVQREQDENMRILNEVSSYFDQKDDFVNQVVREMYTKDDIIYDISYSLQNNYSSYLSYKLNKYSESPSFVPNNMETFVQTYFSDEKDINAISFASDEEKYEYLFIFNHFRWTQSIIKDDPPSLKQYDYLMPQNEQIPEIKRSYQRELKDTYTIKRDLKDPRSLEKLGNFYLYFSFDSLNQFLLTNKERYKGNLYVLNKDGDVFYSSNRKVFPDDLSLPAFRTIQEEKNINGEDYIVSTLADDQLELMFVSYLPKSELQQLSIVLWTMILFTVMLVFIAISATYFIMRSYSKRIYAIEHSMKQVQEGNLDVRVPVSAHKDELSTITVTFNQMLERLKEYINQVYISEIKQKEAEVKALQSNINPHFLYNSLETIRMKALSEGSRTTSDMIVYLGKLFRYSLEHKQIVTVEDEVNHIRQYLNMFQIRYANRLKVEFVIPEDCYELPMMRFTLQPLVENYMIHGFKKQHDNNLLKVVVKKTKDKITITIIDNGEGIEKERLKEVLLNLKKETMGESIGLHNVHQRIQMKYGKQFGLHIESILKQGTCVILTLPILKGGNEDV